MTTPANENESREEIHKIFVTFDDEKTGKNHLMKVIFQQRI
jgi:Ca2+-binding EF-hand superfamily protein